MTSADVLPVARAADPNICGVGLLSPGQEADEGAVVVALNNGSWVKLDTADGSPPTDAAIVALTQADFSSGAVADRQSVALDEEAQALLETGSEALHRAVRASTSATWSNGRNDVAEAFWAALMVVCGKVNVPPPTVDEIATQIRANRDADKYDPGFPAATVAEQGIRRLTEDEILNAIGYALMTGGGNPKVVNATRRTRPR